MKQIIDDAVSALLADIGSTHAELLDVVQRVRHVAAAAGDDVSESVKYGGIMFSHTAFFCGVFAYSGHVTVEFGRGYLLGDHQRMLEGGGKYRRHIKLYSVADIETKHLADYVRQAYELEPPR
ncbi:Uncharacterized conserved protein [Serratia plymuthica]|nr:Uncharacterized conserved protein [Serratia plymuthica]VEI18374.1 Uncharacterized conserved protein [Serratia plymuthica]